jgi:hypothetical protein
VIFHATDKRDAKVPNPVGHVDDKGSFTLTTYTKDDGAPEGDYAVTIEWRTPKKSPFDPERQDKLRGRYSNPKTTPLHAHVASQPNELQPFVIQESPSP